jgi:hypothetical protein
MADKINLQFNPDTMQVRHLKRAAETLGAILDASDMVADDEYHFDAADLYILIMQHRQAYT